MSTKTKPTLSSASCDALTAKQAQVASDLALHLLISRTIAKPSRFGNASEATSIPRRCR